MNKHSNTHKSGHALREYVPPHSVEAEQAVLDGIMLDPEVLSRLEGMLNAGDFYMEAHRQIFTALNSGA